MDPNTNTNVNPDATPNNTPSTTPNTQPAPAAQPSVTPSTTPTVETHVVSQPVGNYAGSSVLETSINIFASTSGIDAGLFDNAIKGALKYNDASLINYSELTAGLKPEHAAQAKALAEAAFQEQSTHLRNETNAVYTLAGSEANWKEAAATFNQSAPAHVRAVVNQMLENGQLQDAAKFVLDTVRGSGMVSSGTPPLQGGTGAPAQGISEAEFRKELNDLTRSRGNSSFEGNNANSQALQELMARRKLGKAQGL